MCHCFPMVFVLLLPQPSSQQHSIYSPFVAYWSRLLPDIHHHRQLISLSLSVSLYSALCLEVKKKKLLTFFRYFNLFSHIENASSHTHTHFTQTHSHANHSRELPFVLIGKRFFLNRKQIFPFKNLKLSLFWENSAHFTRHFWRFLLKHFCCILLNILSCFRLNFAHQSVSLTNVTIKTANKTQTHDLPRAKAEHLIEIALFGAQSKIGLTISSHKKPICSAQTS